jgi:crossover junction endodeoxyribonuclease RuvC
LGIDPGLRVTGWGVIDYDGYRLKHIDHGVIVSDASEEIGDRLANIFKKLSDVIENSAPDEVGVEHVFVNSNPTTSLKLGMARGVALCVPGVMGLKVCEYTPNKIKKTIVGSGHASKEQISMMVQTLLNCGKVRLDAADALAIAICHAHHISVNSIIKMAG